MVDLLFSYIAPHLCVACDEIGALLCDNCKNNIDLETFSACVACGTTSGPTGLCNTCRVPYQKAWCVGERNGELRILIDKLKFEYAYAAVHPLADLLHGCVSDLPPNTVIVPIPTIPSHIRQRGYDHALKIAKVFAKKRKLPLKRVLYRKTTTVQRGASRSDRIRQADMAFDVARPLDPSAYYLIIDDVVTTGATLSAAATALQRSGAKVVWVAAIARQPLD